jgi:flagellar M-ring protein FliF
MKPDRVSVIDESGKLLADGATDNGLASAGADERKVAYETRLRKEVEEIVSSVVGPGRSRVQINADFDINRITQTSDKFDPDGRVVRSSQTREEQSSSGGGGGTVSVGNELPGAAKTQSSGGGSGDQNKKTEEIVNYEVSRTTKTEVIEAGRVNRISAAVLVDGTYDKNDKGEVAYKPRSKEEIDRIAALVRSAIGFDAKRGDQIEVVNLRFAEPQVQVVNEPTGFMSLLQFTKDDMMRGVELFVMAILGLVVVLLVVRPLVRRVITPENPPGLTQQVAGGDPAAAGQLTASGAPALAPPEEPIPAPNSKTAKMIDIAQVKGQVHAQSVQKVGELAEQNPNDAVAIIRSWITEDAA